MNCKEKRLDLPTSTESSISGRRTLVAITFCFIFLVSLSESRAQKDQRSMPRSTVVEDRSFARIRVPGNQLTIASGYELLRSSAGMVSVKKKNYIGGIEVGSIAGNYFCLCEDGDASRTQCTFNISANPTGGQNVDCVRLTANSCTSCALFKEVSDEGPTVQTEANTDSRDRPGAATQGKDGTQPKQGTGTLGLPGSRPGPVANQKEREYQELINRANAIGAKFKSRNPVDAQRARNDWAQMKKDLYSWAQRHSVKLVKKVVMSGKSYKGTLRQDSTAILIYDISEEGIVECGPTKTIDEKRCTLKSATTDGNMMKCEYECPDAKPDNPK